MPRLTEQWPETGAHITTNVGCTSCGNTAYRCAERPVASPVNKLLVCLGCGVVNAEQDHPSGWVLKGWVWDTLPAQNPPPGTARC